MLRSIKEGYGFEEAEDSDWKRDKIVGSKRLYSEMAEKGGSMPPFLKGLYHKTKFTIAILHLNSIITNGESETTVKMKF